MKLVIARHAETNKAANLPGESDTLSPAGHSQLENLIKACRTENVEAVFHSTQSRALSTAEALALALDVPSIEQVGLEERSFGDWDTREWSQIAAELNRLTTDERYTFVPPNGESWQQMEVRLRAALLEIAMKQYKTVAIITHWGSIRALLPAIKNEPKESTLDLNVEFGQAFVMDYQNKAMQIDPRLNDIDDCLYRVAVRVLITQNDKVLLVKEASDDWWALPGGGVDHGETIESTLVREVEEELGVPADKVLSDFQIAYYNIGNVVNGVPRMNLYFRASVPEELLEQTRHVEKWAWFTKDAFMEANLHPSYDRAALANVIFKDKAH